MDNQQLIFWEKQQDKMCGVHCINTLLQGPFYNEVSLAQIGLELDAKEKELMASQGLTTDYLKYMGEGSGNVAEDGNYSLQVLNQALTRISEDLTLTSVDAIKDKTELGKYLGFICNSSAHWFTIRRIGDVWYNLNSTNRTMPQIVSEFLLSAFIMSVKEGGYQIFVVDGTFPPIIPEDFEVLNKNQFWIPAKKIKANQERRMKKSKNFELNILGTDEKDMKDAIKRSLGEKGSSESSEGEDVEEGGEEESKEKKFEAYKGVGAKLGSEEVLANYQKFDMVDPNEDPELFFQIREAMQQNLKDEPTQGTLVFFRLSSGQKISRRFSPTQPIETLYDFVFLHLTQSQLGKKIRFYLSQFVSKDKLLDVTLPISALGPDNRVQLFVNEI